MTCLLQMQVLDQAAKGKHLRQHGKLLDGGEHGAQLTAALGKEVEAAED